MDIPPEFQVRIYELMSHAKSQSTSVESGECDQPWFIPGESAGSEPSIEQSEKSFSTEALGESVAKVISESGAQGSIAIAQLCGDLMQSMQRSWHQRHRLGRTEAVAASLARATAQGSPLGPLQVSILETLNRIVENSKSNV